MSAESQTLNGPETSDVVNDEDNVQLSMAPHVQMYLAQMSQESGCWGRYLPIPFERAAGRSWWDPTFDSEILEEQFKKSASSHNQIKFRYALGYILLLSLSWFIYFLATGIYTSSPHWPLLCSWPISLSLISVGVLLLTRSQLYLDHIFTVSLNIALTLCIVSLAFVVLIPMQSANAPANISPLGHFSVGTEILLLIYTVIPLRLYASIIIAVTYSILFEFLTWFMHDELEYEAITFLVRLLSHVCIHLIGVHILIMTNARMRNTFMKVGQSLLVRKQLESEKKLKENMIHSLMPPSVAQWLLNDDEHFTRNGMVEHRNSNPETATTGAGSEDIETLFRPFNMNRMENVSILFADIVGFTKISGSKTAEQLVEILNDLFQRFDLLCKQNNCEKISTLGDCYYCVSGCPEARPDHARCCVEMGLGMIQSIRQFDQERNEGVNMRVGVHTGTILCGIVGTCRFKFDVWSNDVTLANRMESTGKPGMVHISESTAKFLHGMYVLENGEPVFGLKTYFILSRRTLTDRPSSYNGSLRNSSVSSATNPTIATQPQKSLAETTLNTTSMQLIVSPPTSPPSMSPQTRPRVLSCNTPSLLKPHLPSGGRNPNQLSPDVCKIKANSLPSILDSENEQQEGDVERESDDNEQVQTPTSTASSGRYSVKIKNWKMPRFLRKTSEPNKETTSAAVAEISNDAPSSSNNEESSSGYHQVPMIIETTPSNNSIMDDYSDPTQIILTPPNPGHFTADEEQADTIDVKSYISQSRSDIGQFDYGVGDFTQFIRTGSYRSQYGCNSKDYFLTRAGSNRSRRGKSPNYECIVPSERSRSATVNVIQLEHHRLKKQSLDVPSRLSIIIIDDQQSITGPSINSRKDSGIRSNSRRSSIQPIDHHIQPKNIMGNSHNAAHLPNNSDNHRVSGYYTSSQSSTLTSPHRLSHLQHMTRLPGPFFGKNIQSLRKQSDRQLIKCVQDNTKSRSSYFMKPPLSQPTLFFKDKYIEEQYRANVHAMYEHREPIPTLANSKFNTYFDVFVSAVVFALISTALFVLYEATIVWIVFFSLFVIIQLASIALCVKRVVEFSERNLSCVSRWYRWNCFGGVLVSLPLCSVLVNFSCSVVFSDYIYSYLLLVGIIHYCNFTQLNCWMKSILCTIFAAIFLYLSVHAPCTAVGNQYFNDSPKENSTVLHHRAFLFDSEILMDIILLMILVWGLNREFEIYYRDGFHTNFVATRDKFHVQSLKNQADWLIYNIVPEHVAEQLKQDAKYSENFKDVAIIFASIVNFNEMYDESYLGGKEFLRVLNELIGDFDELLNIPEFHCVEKIKTIGSTFMAASGLNSMKRLEQKDPNEHLYALMDFAIAMQDVITNFNRDLLEFNLILRIGYNFGDVTAAVIGQTKLYYDIWGDAVNIASRMDSTGVNGRIQVGEHCLRVLSKKYQFEQRGSVYVKGKDNMNVYLLSKKIEGTD